MAKKNKFVTKRFLPPRPFVFASLGELKPTLKKIRKRNRRMPASTGSAMPAEGPKVDAMHEQAGHAQQQPQQQSQQQQPRNDEERSTNNVGPVEGVELEVEKCKMDLEALKYTRDHYNRHAGTHVDQQSALKARAHGPSAPLKRFHNSIKRALINRFAYGAEKLLDLACGRGGDLWKWIDANITYVKGIDLSPGEIEEARGRYNAAVKKKGSVGTFCEFMDSSMLGIEEYRDGKLYDAVTCMFALHYFFVSEKALKQFLHNVSINLKPGGYFFGTVPDGKSINQCVMASRKFTSPMLMIEARWKGMPSTFGSPYVCAIGDTVTGGEQGTEGSLEYLVYQNVLVAVAKEFGLEPVVEYNDPTLDACLKPDDAGRVMKHFAPSFPESDPSLETASSLFTTFVFRKKEGPSTEQDNKKVDGPSDPRAKAKASTKQFKKPLAKRMKKDIA